MPGSKADYLESAVIDYFLRPGATAPTRPTSLSLALCTADPGEGTGAVTNEVSASGTAYARQAVTFGAPAAGVTSNSALIGFPQATASWGTVTYWVLLDNGGNKLYTGSIDTPAGGVAVNTGGIFEVASGAFQVTET
jgi:hypothetical protein